MKFGVPWSVKGIRPEARETAKEAARRSGMSLGDWLNSVIIQQAEQAGVQSPPLADENFHGGDLAAVNHRLDDLAAAHRAARAARARGLRAETHPQRARSRRADGRLDRRLDQFASAPPPAMPSAAVAARASTAPSPKSPRASACSTAVPRRRRSNTPQAAMAAPAPAPLPAQDLSGLEDQLRNITDQIETLRKPGVEQAINALREELGEIGRTLSDAMPRRALDAIEKQIQGLDQRIAEGRQAGVDAAALGGIEHGLAEVRDALARTDAGGKPDRLQRRGGRPRAQDRSHRRAERPGDAGAARKRHHHAARDDQSCRLQRDRAAGSPPRCRRWARRSNTWPAPATGGDALNHLEHRIAALSDALTERAQSGAAVPPRLEALVESLADKIEQIQNSRGNGDAFGHLEDRIVKLVEKLDASDSRLGHLEGIERGLADLLVHIEDMRANKDAGGLRAQGSPRGRRPQARYRPHPGCAGSGARHARPRRRPPRHDRKGYSRRAHARAARPRATRALNQPVGKVAVRAVSDAPAAPAPMPRRWQPQLAPPPAPRRMPPAAQPPIDPDLPADQPLEPGSGPPPLHANPAARIAASEAALGGARPAAAPGGKSSFIAAARRAAQAAGQQPNGRAPRAGADRCARARDSHRCAPK